ncbi:hypothetical protein [uncultured Pseudoalteromonas sp.]|nr:hypothetical protein [uncultured Pseudoalteromonas sp.]
MQMCKVLVENLYYDGPRGGITSIEGRHYRFVSDFNDDSGFTDEFSLYLISESELELEIEQWQIFVKWHKKYISQVNLKPIVILGMVVYLKDGMK